MSKKLVYFAVASIIAAVCLLTSGWFSTTPNNQADYMNVRNVTTVKANKVHKQEGNLCKHIEFPQQAYSRHLKKHSSHFPYGGPLKKFGNCITKGNYNIIFNETVRRESMPFFFSAPRLYYVIALRRIVI